jgi:hypothetical protein
MFYFSNKDMSTFVAGSIKGDVPRKQKGLRTGLSESGSQGRRFCRARPPVVGAASGAGTSLAAASASARCCRLARRPPRRP